MTNVDAIEVETGPNATGAVIWMHGLGADGRDFEPMVPGLVQRNERALRFVFPHAPVRRITLNGGHEMRAWYDIAGVDRQSRQDEAGIRASDALVRTLVERENQRGITTERIVLAGFSQGGAMALYSGTRYPQRLAGIVGLSCYMLLAPKFDAERSPANHITPIFLAHGTQDDVLHPLLGDETRQLLEATNYSVEWHTYAMPHAVCPEEVADIAEWLRRVLP